MLDLREIARVLGGTVSGRNVLVPGPGHSPSDRSLSITVDPNAPNGYWCHSFAGDGWQLCRAHIDRALGLPQWDSRRRRQAHETRGKARAAPTAADHERLQHGKAFWLWSQRHPISGSIGECYLRRRGYNGTLPPTLGFLPASRGHPPAMIAAYAVPEEPEPGVLAAPQLKPANAAVHLTRLLPDGSDRERGDRAKITIGSPLGRPIVLAPPNDLLGLAICEGIEDALSAHEATGLGAWAAGSASFMPKLADAVPEYIEVVTIYAHDDTSGKRGAVALANALHDRGTEVYVEGLG